jgi:hypothetical protein
MKKRQFLFIFIALQVLTNCKKEIKNPVYQYYPMNINNEWVYAINNFYGGLDTLHIKVIGKSNLSNNQPCWQMAYKDNYGLYNDTTYTYISDNKDTVLTYSNQNDTSLSEKWILSDVINNTWTGVSPLDKFIFQASDDSMSSFHITYSNVWNIDRAYYYGTNGIYKDLEQFYFEANVGLCFYTTSQTTPNELVGQEWHLISYQLY